MSIVEISDKSIGDKKLQSQAGLHLLHPHSSGIIFTGSVASRYPTDHATSL